MIHTATEFMARVLPWPGPGEPGLINLHYQFSPKDRPNKPVKDWPWSGRPFNSLVDLMGYVNWLNTKPDTHKNIFYCLSRQLYVNPTYSNGKLRVQRGADQATFLKALWIDIDVKKPPKGYTTLEQAAKAVLVFARSAGIPFPNALVASGGGLHAYWISDKILGVDEWRPYAEGLKALAIKHKLRCDAGLTTDPARVLRVPGTYNFKEIVPREVRLLQLDATDYDFAKDMAHIAVNVPTVTATVTRPPTLDLSHITVSDGFKASFDATESLSDGVDSFREIQLDWTLVEQGCPFFKDAKATGGKDHGQPLWNLAILATTFFENGNVLAHELSNGYPAYTVDETDKMYERKAKERETKNLGWPSCAKIAGEGCTLCAGCPHFGKIKSPLELGKVHPTPAPRVLASTSPASQALMLPNTGGEYFVDQDGFICQMLSRKGRGGDIGEEQAIRLFNCLIRDPVAHGDPRRGISFHVKTDVKTWERATILAAEWSTQAELNRSMNLQGVLYNYDAKPLLERFFMSWLTRLNNAIAATKNRPFGWVFNDDGKCAGFAFGGRTFYADGREEMTAIPDRALGEVYKPIGSTQPWFEALDLIIKQRRPHLDILVLSAFSTPVLRFTGGTGGTCVMYGKSGTNKTSASQVAMAVWGDPITSKLKPNATANSVEGILSSLDCLPVLVDDVQKDEHRQSMCDLMFEVTSGRDKSRMKQNAELRFPKKSKTSLMITANASMYDYMFNVYRVTTEAHPARCLEIEMPAYTPAELSQLPGRVSQTDAEKVLNNLEYNHGGVGVEYAKWLALNLEYVEQYCSNVAHAIETETNIREAERFWKSFIASILSAAHFVDKAFGIKFDVEAIHKVLIDGFMRCRRRIEDAQVEGSSQTSVESILASFLMRWADSHVYTWNLPTGKGRSSVIAQGPPPRHMPLKVQWCVEDRLVRFDVEAFTDFLIEKKYPVTSVLDGMQKHLGAKRVKFRLGGGLECANPPRMNWVIPIPMYHFLESQLYKRTEPERVPDHVTLADDEFTAAVTAAPMPVETGLVSNAAVVAQVQAATRGATP